MIKCQGASVCVWADEKCDECMHQIDGTGRKQFFQQYRPVCPEGRIDCKFDPGKIYYYSYQDYRNTYGRWPPEVVTCQYHKKEKGNCGHYQVEN